MVYPHDFLGDAFFRFRFGFLLLPFRRIRSAAVAVAFRFELFHGGLNLFFGRCGIDFGVSIWNVLESTKVTITHHSDNIQILNQRKYHRK